MIKKKNSYLMIWVIVSFIIVFVVIKYISPYIFMVLLAKGHSMPTPSTLIIWYMILAVLGGLIFVSTSSVRWENFLSFVLPAGDDSTKKILQITIIVAFPLLVGWFVYSGTAPGTASPVELRIQHPTLPQKFENIKNPYTHVDEEAKRRCIEEGKIMYQQNCRPCHGSKADGNGPFANSFRLRPINFTDPGTIATVIENYAFWRIKEGGPGLPGVSTPWDSAMPAWKDALNDEQIWKIIMGEYKTAGVVPRQTETLEH
ncbi:MAG: cytochrome c [Candidatus Scalindua sp.]|nr:cytochrome c [Candidatus Scalindua sp.]MCR4344845.1 cytochrome c [Candidatus Scalindua sp.]